MTDPIRTVEEQQRLKKPNFLLIVILAGISLIVIFVGAYLMLSDDGRKLLPRLRPDPHPTSMVVRPGHTVRGVTVEPV